MNERPLSECQGSRVVNTFSLISLTEACETGLQSAGKEEMGLIQNTFLILSSTLAQHNSPAERQEAYHSQNSVSIKSEAVGTD